jgi:hypothetical protein
MDGRADGARHALCPLWHLSLACRTAVGQAFSPDLSNHDSHLTVATKGWCAGGVPERLGWSHVAAVALHSAIDIKCTCHVDCPEELRCTTVPVPAPQAGGVTSCLSIDVKCARRFDCPGELIRTAVPVATRSLAIDVKCARRTDYPRELWRTTIPLPAR